MTCAPDNGTLLLDQDTN